MNIRVWISKYALSDGIKEVDARVCQDVNSNMIEVRNPNVQYYHRGEWHRTPQAAQDKAEIMRTNRISSLQKQISKLEKLKFCGE